MTLFKRSPYNVFLLCFFFVLTACAGNSTTRFTDGEKLFVPEFAAGFEITAWGESSVLTITDPWQGASGVLHNAFLSRNGESAPAGFDGPVIPVPLKRVVCMSSSYVAFIDALGELAAVKGVSGARYITNEHIRVGHLEGSVRDVGYDANINYELLTALDPDLVFIYGVAGENSSLTQKLAELGVNVMYIGDYVEQSPLGKAEWIVAFGELFDKRNEAEKIFTEVKEEYFGVQAAVAEYIERSGARQPVVMLNAPWRDTWFVPGDRSYMVKLITDGGGIYACRGEDSEQTRPISTEAAFVYARDADVWLNPGQVNTLAEVVSLNPRFEAIPAVMSGRVYNATLRSTSEGGSDFWESGAVRPDIVLSDMVEMLHPGVIDHSLYYFKKME